MCPIRHPRTHTGRLAHSHSHSYSTQLPILIPFSFPFLFHSTSHSHRHPHSYSTQLLIPTKIPILIPSDEKAIRHKGFTGHRGMSGFPLATHPKDSSYAITSWCICRRGTDIMTSALSFCHNTSASSVKQPQLSILRFSPLVWGDSCT